MCGFLQHPVSKALSSDDILREPREGDSVDGIMGSNVDIAELVGEKEGQLQLKQLVESHHIDLP